MHNKLYTIDKIFSETNKDGWKLFFTNMFNIDDSLAREEPDTLSLDVIFKDSDLKEILDYHEEHGIKDQRERKSHLATSYGPIGLL